MRNSPAALGGTSFTADVKQIHLVTLANPETESPAKFSQVVVEFLDVPLNSGPSEDRI